MTYSPAWLLSSVGRRGELVKILRTIPLRGTTSRVTAVDLSPFSSAGLLADEFGLVPPVGDPGFIPRVISHAGAFGATTIIPTIDPELSVYAEHVELLSSRGIAPWVSSAEVCQLGYDKWKFSRWCHGAGIPTARTAEAGSTEPTGLAGPIIAKPRSGSASKGIMEFASEAEARAADLPEHYILQEKTRGDEVTVDFAVARDGRLLGYSPRKRLEVRAGEVSKAVTIEHPLVTDVLHEAARCLDGAFGVLNLQLFLDEETDSVSALELNPRFGGGYPLTHYAGCDLISAVLESESGQSSRIRIPEPGVVMLRYDTQVITSLNDIEAMRR